MQGDVTHQARWKGAGTDDFRHHILSTPNKSSKTSPASREVSITAE